MNRYVAIVMFQGLVEDVSAFEDMNQANGWVTTLRQLYGWEDTSDSVIWDVVNQAPAEM